MGDIQRASDLRKEVQHLRKFGQEHKAYTTGFTALDDGDLQFRLAKGRFMILTGIPGMGKALALDTAIPTPAGMKTMEDLKVGDKVYDEKGRPCRVTAVTPVMYNRPCYKMTFSTGETVVCDEEHLWVTRDETARASANNAKEKPRLPSGELRPKGTDQSHLKTYPSAKTTGEISRTITKYGRKNHHIDVCLPVSGGSDIDLPIDPYTLGVWLGDGRTDYASIYCNEEEMVRRIRSAGYTLREQAVPHHWGIINGFLGSLRKAGLIGNKHIPKEYLYAPLKKRIALMQGLMDTDGYCDFKTGTCEFSSTRRVLAYGMQELLCSLGYRATVREGRAMLYGKDCGEKFRVTFTPDGSEVFHLRRKQDRVRKGSSTRTKRRTIVSCEKVESVPVRCIAVDSPSHQYLCTTSYIPTHNSEFLDALVVNMSVLHNWKILYFSPENNPPDEHVAALVEKMVGKKIRNCTIPEVDEAMNFIDYHIYWTCPKDKSIDNLLAIGRRVKELAGGLDMMIIDPWNYVDQNRHGDMLHEHLSNSLNKVTNFTREENVLLAIVAHPINLPKDKNGNTPVPDLYSISDGAQWRNKADYGIVIHRGDMSKDEIQFYCGKRKKKWMGNIGMVSMDYDKNSGRFKAKEEKEFLLPTQPQPPF